MAKSEMRKSQGEWAVVWKALADASDPQAQRLLAKIETSKKRYAGIASAADSHVLSLDRPLRKAVERVERAERAKRERDAGRRIADATDGPTMRYPYGQPTIADRTRA